MAQLHELVTVDSIRLNVRARNWRAAIQAVGKVLTGTGVGTPAYTEAMIANVEEHGPYIVIAPGFAFAHAQAPGTVKRTGMAWLRLRKPVEFGNELNDPVTLIAALASTDSTQYIQAMRQLISLVTNESTRERLERAVDPEEFVAALGHVGRH